MMMDDIKKAVSVRFGIPVTALESRRRSRHLAHARWVCFTLGHRCGLTLSQIGSALGRDHSTVCYGLNQVEARKKTDTIFAEMLDQLFVEIMGAL